jgi:catechol 2,3-dioxygenase-like lactoylglutathione lyase family enzyme
VQGILARNNCRVDEPAPAPIKPDYDRDPERQQKETEKCHMTQTTVRYFVTDVDEAIDFYCNRLGFHVDLPLAPGFAGLAKDDLRLLLHEPGVGGAGKAGGVPTPGGWNRFQIVAADLDATVERLAAQGATFRGEIVEGPGGRQILIEDPSGNPVELFQPGSA